MRNYAALITYLSARVRTRFAWWENDCVTHGAGAVEAMTGRDLLREFGSTWSTAEGAARVLRRAGGLVAAVDSLLPRISPSMAMRGDLGVARIGPHDCLVVVEGQHLVGPGLEGQVRLPRAQLTFAWKVD